MRFMIHFKPFLSKRLTSELPTCTYVHCLNLVHGYEYKLMFELGTNV